MGNKHYTVERLMVDVSKWWQFSKLEPKWCLVEHGTVDINENDITESQPYVRAYSRVIMHNDDYELIRLEHDYFNKVIPACEPIVMYQAPQAATYHEPQGRR